MEHSKAGLKQISEEPGFDQQEARRLLLLHGSVREVLNNYTGRMNGW